MEVVALVSGGKDSCFAMLKCIEYGHKIVALANLMPVDDSVDELDSYMYQTVGHQIVESYAVCMGLPLFRRRICGSARLQNLKYDETPGDEVEDMFLLLSEIKRQIPSVAAVCSGAIASDYQRLRVENVCSRLGLVSLAYLWKQDQSLLLQEMISKGIVAIFVKVAAMGLYPSKHLGQELSSLQNLLHELKESFGINVCGEGGEYETLTIDCPLFKNAKIVLDDVQIVMYSSDSIAPVGALHPSAFHLEAKSSLCINNELNDEGKNISCVHEVEGDSKSLACQVKHPPMDFQFKEDSVKSGMLNISRTRGTDFSVGCWIQNSNKTADLQTDLAYVLWKIETELQQGGFSWKDVLYIHLYLSDMGQFAVANRAYLNFITDKACHLGVPSRCTVELPLVEAGLGHAYVEVRVANATSKRVLHVQSISSWAPSCIGPYSQATLDKEVLHMAGQLGLDPPTMKLCSSGAINELEQAVKNCEAVAQVFNCHITSSVILVVIYCSASSKLSERTEIQNKEAALFRKHLESEVKPKEDCRVLHPIFLYVLVPSLPKGALVEVKPLLYVPDSEDALSPVVLCERDTRLSKLWGFEQIDRQDLCLQSCIINGKISALILSITKSEADKLHLETGKLLKVNNADFGTENLLRRLARFCVCILDEILLQYNNSWQEVKSLRFYFNVSFCKDANLLRGLFSEAFDELAAQTQRLNRSSLDIFNVIPVLGSGRTTAMEDLITCELFVSKL